MAKSVRKPRTNTKAKPRTSSKSKAKSKTKKKSSCVDMPIGDLINIGISATESVVNIIGVISENRLKTKELELEGNRFKAEITDKISQRENETMQILKKYEIDLKDIGKSMLEIESNHKERIIDTEFKMQQSSEQHEYRMKGLDIIEKIVDVSLSQYTEYQKSVIFKSDYPVVDTTYLEALNTTIEKLTGTVAEANIGGFLTYTEEG